VYSANEEIVRLKKQSETEILKLQTIVKRYELRIQNLEQVVEQKVIAIDWCKLVYLSLVEPQGNTFV
jgi:hypothetical protein